MAKKNNRKCICCSTEYRYCNTCSEDATKPAWYAIYCSENCKKLFSAASGYHSKTATIEEVRARFDACDLSYKDKLGVNFIEAINAVYGIEEEISEVKEDVPYVNIDEKEVINTENKIETTKKPKHVNQSRKSSI